MSRAVCPRCERPIDYCYCSELAAEQADINLVILQHPKETRHPMNTARIAELGISNCEIWVGEDFTEHQPLLNLIKLNLIKEKQCYLLFPGPDAQDSKQVLQKHTPDVVIIIDGTWRKAKRILHLNPQLQALPALSLNHEQLSNYRIRKAPDTASLSTVEAAVLLLRQVSNKKNAHQSLLDVFDRMVQMQIERMGNEVYQNNYADRIQPKD